MAVTLADGQEVDVEALNQEFARSQLDLPTDATAPAPPKRDKSAPKPAVRRTSKTEPKKTINAPVPASDKLLAKRKEAGADIMHTFAVVSEVLHATTGDEAWKKDAELYVNVADTFGQACAQLAEKSPKFAAYLDSDSNAAGAYLAFGLVTSQIAMGVVDNHGARAKIPAFIKKASLYLKVGSRKIFKKRK